ncbi:MAG: hypothetical protein EXR79_15865 [Myxococcales bacterium]|nr:hypothetical protein [Myxococcales bacterium]
MIRHVVERGLASVVAKLLLDGGAEALLARVERAGVLKPEDMARVRRETLDHLGRVHDDGAAYADVMWAGLKEVGAHLPEFQQILRQVGGLAVAVAQQSAEAAALRAKVLAERSRAGTPTAAAAAATPAPGATSPTEALP